MCVCVCVYVCVCVRACEREREREACLIVILGFPFATLIILAKRSKCLLNVNAYTTYHSIQLDIQRLKDACKGYGDVKSFIGSPGADFVLVCYSSVEEAMRAKPCIDRLWGGHVSTEFVPEGDLEMHCQQLTMSEPSVFAPPPKQVPPSSFHPTLAEGERSRWDSQDMRAFSFERQASKASTPGSSSVWSDGGFLSGISSPWSSDFSGTLASPSTGYHSDILSTSSAATTPLTQDSIESSSSRNSSVLPTFLPSGLL